MAASWRRAVWFPKEDGAGQNQTPHPSLAIVGLILLNHYVQFSWIFWVLLTYESLFPINYETECLLVILVNLLYYIIMNLLKFDYQ